MTEEQIMMLRDLIKLEVELTQADGMDHGSWGWTERQLTEGWESFKNSVISDSLKNKNP